MTLIASSGFGGDSTRRQAARHLVAALTQDRQYVPPALKQTLSQEGVIGHTSPLGKALGRVANATGLPVMAQTGIWNLTHPWDISGNSNPMGSGPNGMKTGEVPWVAGRPWFHGSSRVFEKPNPAKANPMSLYGPGHYVTDDPAIASTYTGKGEGAVGNQRVSRHPLGGRLKDRVARARADLESQGLTVTSVRRAAPGDQHVLVEFQPRDYGPNVTRYAFEPDEVFDIQAPIGQADRSRLLKALENEPQVDRARLAAQEVAARASDRVNSMNALWHVLENHLGSTRANEVIRAAGYDAIRYPGGKQTGGKPHNALVVLNDALLRRGGVPNPRHAGVPRPTHGG